MWPCAAAARAACRPSRAPPHTVAWPENLTLSDVGRILFFFLPDTASAAAPRLRRAAAQRTHALAAGRSLLPGLSPVLPPDVLTRVVKEAFRVRPLPAWLTCAAS